MCATVNVAVHDAVNELVSSNVFLQTISFSVTKKTFETSVADISRKVQVNETQLEKALQENGATVLNILQTALVPQLA